MPPSARVTQSEGAPRIEKAKADGSRKRVAPQCQGANAARVVRFEQAAFGGSGADLTMPVLKRSSLYMLACAGTALAIVMGAAPPAESKPPTMGELLTGCAQRVDELEREVRLLRHELAQQRASRATPDSDVGRFEDPSVSAHTVSECTVPFQISKGGIKRFKHRCLEALQILSPCDVPFEVDERGVKSFKLHCL
jgi:hypothetical protein